MLNQQQHGELARRDPTDMLMLRIRPQSRDSLSATLTWHLTGRVETVRSTGAWAFVTLAAEQCVGSRASRAMDA